MIESKRYKSKPIYIETVAVTENNYLEVAEWLDAQATTLNRNSDGTVVIEFRELPQTSNIYVSPGDFISKDEDGGCSRISQEDIKKFWKRA